MARPITWQSIAAPDFGDANRLLQTGLENIQSGVEGIGDLAKNQEQKIYDQNTSTIASRILNTRSGFDGMDDLNALQTELGGIDPSLVGGKAGLKEITSLFKDRKSALDSQVAEIADTNSSAIAARIMGTNVGLDGIDELDSLGSELSKTNFREIGGTKGATDLMNLINARKTEIELSALSDYNSVAAEAHRTGDYSELDAIEESGFKKVRGSLDAITNARSVQEQKDMLALAKEVELGNVDDDSALALLRPGSEHSNIVYSALASRTNNTMVASLLTSQAENIAAVTSGGRSSQDVVKGMLSNLTDEFISKNTQVISSLIKQISDAEISSMNFTETELQYSGIMDQELSEKEKLFNDKTEEIKRRVSVVTGIAPRHLNVFERYGTGHPEKLGIMGIVKTRYPSAEEPESIAERILEIVNSIKDKDGVHYAALAAAIDNDDDLDNPMILNNPEAFKASLMSYQKQYEGAAKAYDAMHSGLLARQSAFIDYKVKSLKTKQENLISMRDARRSGASEYTLKEFPKLPEYEVERIMSEIGAKGLPTKKPGKNTEPIDKDVKETAAKITTSNAVDMYKKGEVLSEQPDSMSKREYDSYNKKIEREHGQDKIREINLNKQLNTLESRFYNKSKRDLDNERIRLNRELQDVAARITGYEDVRGNTYMSFGERRKRERDVIINYGNKR